MIDTARFSHAEGEDWRSAARACIAQLQPIPAAANLGFVYLTDAMAGHTAEILRYLREHTPVAHWVGGVGAGICATGAEFYGRPAIAVLAGVFPPESFRVFSTLSEGAGGFEETHGAWCNRHQPFFGVVHGDPACATLPAEVTALSERMGGGFLVGGLTSSRGEQAQIADTITSGGLSGVLFNAQVAVTTRLTQGCTPIGPRHQITQCEQNFLVELDGRPALDVFNEDIGEVLARDLNKVAGYIFAGLPIEGSDTGDYMTRNLVGIDPINKIIAIGDRVGTGDPILFCRRDADSAEEDLLRMLGEVRRALPGPAKGALYYSCIGRGVNLFGPNAKEMQTIAAALGPVPLVGFYANGEISFDRLYGYTGVLTVFS